MALHPTHRHNKARKILLELVLLQGSRDLNSTHQYAGEEFLVIYQGDLDVDHLCRELFRALDRTEEDRWRTTG
jgi:hypothetical protein